MAKTVKKRLQLLNFAVKLIWFKGQTSTKIGLNWPGKLWKWQKNVSKPSSGQFWDLIHLAWVKLNKIENLINWLIKVTVTALMSLSWPGKVCLHMPSRMSQSWNRVRNWIFERFRIWISTYFCRCVTCARNEGAHVWREGEGHNVSSMACVCCALLSSLDVP